jgi:hypothetical protein
MHEQLMSTSQEYKGSSPNYKKKIEHAWKNRKNDMTTS